MIPPIMKQILVMIVAEAARAFLQQQAEAQKNCGSPPGDSADNDKKFAAESAWRT